MIMSEMKFATHSRIDDKQNCCSDYALVYAEEIKRRVAASVVAAIDFDVALPPMRLYARRFAVYVFGVCVCLFVH